MKNFTITSKLLLISLLVSSFACKKEGIKEGGIDFDLNQLLEEAAPNGSTSFFRLPNSDDYSSIPQDPRNPITTNKVDLGQMLFHETGIAQAAMLESGKGTYSCASCHFAGAGFQAGRHQGIGEGGIGFGKNGEGRVVAHQYTEEDLDVQPIRTPSAMNGAYQRVTLWNGQFGSTGMNRDTEYAWTEGTPIEANHLGYEGLETQAIAGLKVHRLEINQALVESLGYTQAFDQAFSDVPPSERYTREMAGLAIAAYERTVLANQAPFQVWLNGKEDAMSRSEKYGAILFFGKAQCFNCHTGPALNSMEFYALGMNDLASTALPTMGTSPGDKANLGRASFTNRPWDFYKFKVPQLYNLADSPFYGHGSSFTSIEEVLNYKNLAVPENANVLSSQLPKNFRPLNLSEEEIDQLVTFLEISLRDPDLERYQPPHILSGNCFPNNDQQSAQDLGCR
ncbi:MAG: cytochrome-c peroxidase [Saprospiraceae bacterium]|nr:cytochrome-c peroxidase [Saprospiraceae bacterium]